MTTNFYQPPTIYSEAKPLIFLAGPIQGAPNWHELAKRKLMNNQEVCVASPKREKLAPDFKFSEQVDWESHHLNKAAENGCILFWLAKEAERVEGRHYAQTTRFELGEWTAKSLFTNCNIVVGIEEGFTNARYIKRRLTIDCPSIPILETLDETCEKAIQLILE